LFCIKISYTLAYEIIIQMSNELIRVQVSSARESATSYGCLVDLRFDDKGNEISAMRLVWFPKSICTYEVVEYERDWFGKIIIDKKYFMTAPKWFLDKNEINYKDK